MDDAFEFFEEFGEQFHGDLADLGKRWEETFLLPESVRYAVARALPGS